jgi:hypothetical protein
MKSHIASKFLLNRILDEFEREFIDKKYPNQVYLEKQISKLENAAIQYRSQSRDPKLTPRIRARSRDLEQNTLGLLNGIKFAIAFWNMKDEDIEKVENPESGGT